MTQLPTYKTDDSFFTLLAIPGNPHRWSLFRWFEKSNQSKFRFIRDTEIETDYLNLEQIEDIYPGIKTIVVVSNPWIRAKFIYDQICAFKKANESRQIPATTIDFNLESFEAFVHSIKTTQPTSKYWFLPTTPQVDWVTYNDRKCSYILHAENIDEEFKVIQDYFELDIPLDMQDKIPEYRHLYSNETKQIVEELFYKDIEAFRYKF